jgi:DNA primase
VRNVVATSGTALTAEHAQMIRRYAPQVTLLFDGDAAGIQAAQRGMVALAPVSLMVRVLILPEEFDPDEYVRQRGADEFMKLLERAQDGFDFVLGRAIGAHGLDTAHAKSAVVGDMAAVLDEVADDIVRADYVKRIADRLSVPEQLVLSRLKRATPLSPPKPAEKAPVSHAPSVSLANRPEGHFLRLLLSHPELITEAREYVGPDVLTDKFANELYSIVGKAFQQGGSLLRLLDLAENDDQKRCIAELSAAPVAAADPQDELVHTVVELQKKFLRTQLRAITQQLRQTPTDRALLQQQRDVSIKLKDLGAGQA